MAASLITDEQPPEGLTPEIVEYLTRMFRNAKLSDEQSDRFPKLTALPVKPVPYKLYYFEPIAGTRIYREGFYWYVASTDTWEYMGVSDFFFDANAGRIGGHSSEHKFGWRGNASTTKSHIWNSPTVTDLVWQTFDETLDINSNDANDTLLGTGARTVIIEGLDDNFDEISETIELNGITAVTTTALFRRVQRAWVVDSGAYGGTNIGDIVISGSVSGDPFAYISPSEGQTQNTQYTVPAGKTGYLIQISLTTEANKSADFSLRKRENANVIIAPFTAIRIVHEWNGIEAPLGEPFKANHILPEKTDIWVDGVMSIGTGILQCDYDLILVDNAV